MPEVNHSVGNKTFLVSVIWAQLGVRITWIAWFVYFVQLLFCLGRRCCHLPPPHCHLHWKSRDKYSLSLLWDNKSLCPKFLLNDELPVGNTSETLPSKPEFWGYRQNTGFWWHGSQEIIEHNSQWPNSPSSVPGTCSNWGKTEGPQLMAEGDTSDVVPTLPHHTCLALAAASLRGKCSAKWVSRGV